MRNRQLSAALIFLLAVLLAAPAKAQEGSVVGYLNDAPRSFLQETPYLTQCELGCTVADAVREAAGTQIALVNWGDIQNDLNQGSVTSADISRVFSKDRSLATATVPPDVLFQILEHAVSQIQLDSATERVVAGTERFDGFCQVSGFRFRYDASAPVGSRVVQIILEDGTELTSEGSAITLTATEYMLTGGYGFAPVDCTPLGCSLTDALADYVSLRTGLPEGETQRITMIGGRNNLIADKFPGGLLIGVVALLAVFLVFFRMRAKTISEYE